MNFFLNSEFLVKTQVHKNEILIDSEKISTHSAVESIAFFLDLTRTFDSVIYLSFTAINSLASWAEL